MPNFKDGTGNPFGLGLLPAIGLTIARTFLAAWGIAVFIAIVVPGVLAAGVAAAAVRRVKFHKADRSGNPLVIEGEYEVLSSGTGTS